MAELLIDFSGCTSALQFLDTFGKAMGKPLGTFSMLENYLVKNYHPQIIFVGMKEFRIRCPQATKEMEMILSRVQWHYQEERKEFEYELSL